MASSLLALIDDIASILDDVALLSKAAAKKTTGVLGDDLALNAQQVSGIAADRELPVVWAVARGSLVNKAILVPGALGISALVPWLITPLLMAGGAYLCFEGFEKVLHVLTRKRGAQDAHHVELAKALADSTVDLVALERDRIKGAVRTDFILSAEIIVITLGTVASAPFAQRVTVLTAIALLMTVGVYGLVAGIVKLDDGGLYLSRRGGEGAVPRLLRGLGNGLLGAAPWLMKGLSVAGTVAMFLVGGGILSHGIPPLHHWVQGLGPGWLLPLLMDAVVGLAAGGLVAGAVLAGTWLRARLVPARVPRPP